jgi:transcriptional regulator with XRE-family HTH domain
MSVAVNNRFAVLLAEKQIKERRNISLAEVAETAGVARKTLYAWENNTVTRFDVSVIDAICKYFGVKPGDLFEYVEDPQPKPKRKKRP